MKPIDTKGALHYRTTRAFLYFLYCHFHYLLFCVLEHNVWNILKRAISARGIQDETLADIHIHTQRHTLLLHTCITRTQIAGHAGCVSNLSVAFYA